MVDEYASEAFGAAEPGHARSVGDAAASVECGTGGIDARLFDVAGG